MSYKIFSWAIFAVSFAMVVCPPPKPNSKETTTHIKPSTTQIIASPSSPIPFTTVPKPVTTPKPITTPEPIPITQIFFSKSSTPKDSEEDTSKKPHTTDANNSNEETSSKKPHRPDNNSEEDNYDDHSHHKKHDDDCNSLKTIIKKAIKYNFLFLGWSL